MNWYKKAQGAKQYRVVDNEFNRANYSDIIGEIYDSPPGYANVEVVEQAEEIKPTTPNPLNGKSKQSSRNYIYRLVGDMTKGFFTDDSWENVNAIWKKLDEAGIENYLTDAKYYRNERGESAGKMWKFEVPFINNRGKEDKLYGTLTASFAGSIQDPSERYDISFVI